MKKILICIAVIGLLIGACERVPEMVTQGDDRTFVKFTAGDIIPGQYIVVLKPDLTTVKTDLLSFNDAQIAMAGETQRVLAVSGIKSRTPLCIYSAALQGFAINLSVSEAEALSNNASVEGVYPDRMFILAKPGTNPSQPAQQTPPGITRVGGGATYTGNAKAWIIDTGIDLDHPDLNVNTALGRNFIATTKTPDDDNGHGTHCAGIVAAINNTVGVVGVAAGAQVVPVKVLDRRGSGAYSVIISGVNYVAGNATAGDAVNMSLGGGVYAPIDEAVVAMASKGLYVALAAGNESDDANNHSPARANGATIWTVSACDKNNVWAYFSNYGNPPIDYCAPGVSILSTYKGGAYATMSGTSMAAPHVCGVLLATGGHPGFDGYVTGDPDGEPDPIVHK